MRRGSVSTWKTFGRRNSENMAQFTAASAVEFMTTDDIKYKRQGGWFLSYKRAIFLVLLFILGLIAAVIVGWCVNSLSREQVIDVPEPIVDEIDDDPIDESFILSLIRPLKYYLRLIPVITDNEVTGLKGRVVIEFRIDGAAVLNELTLNAINITATRYELSLLKEDRQVEVQRNGKQSDGSQDGDGDGRLTMTRKEEKISNDGSDDESTINLLSEITRKDRENFERIDISRNETDDVNGLCVVRPSKALKGGTYLLMIDYEAFEDGYAIYTTNLSDHTGGGWLLGTRIKSVGAGRLFPTFDDANLKASFALSVALPRDMTALSNMPLKNSTNTTNDWKIDTFEDTPPLLPRNLALAIGDFEEMKQIELGDAKTPTTLWAKASSLPENPYLFEKLEPAVAVLTDALSMSYPLPKLDLVSLPSNVVPDAASPGLMSIRKSLLRVTKESPIVERMNALKTTIGLLGEQWLGGTVSTNWTDAWILKGALLHLQYELLDEIDSSFHRGYSFVAEIEWRTMERDGYSASRSLRARVNVHSSNAYASTRHEKGACLIRMLHGAINDTAFRNGYRKFITRWANATTTVDEFWSTMGEEVTDLPKDVTLTQVMDAWTAQGGYPVVIVTRNYEKEYLDIRQIRFTYDKPSMESDKFWYIPLTYVTKNDDFSCPTRTWFYSTSDTIREIGNRSTWVLFNVNKTGYYRVHYDEENWKLLAMALEENHEVFPAETRASLIDDVFGLAALGFAKYDTAFNFIKYMQMKERHYAPWGTFAHYVFILNNLLYESTAFADFQGYVRKFVSSLYAEEKSKLEEGNQLTSIAIQLACFFEHLECVDWAKKTFTEIRIDPSTKNTVPEFIRGTLYCTVAKYGNRDEWNYFFHEVRSIVDREEKVRLLSSFACFQVPWILHSVVNKILYGNEFDEDDISIVLESFSMNPAAARIAYNVMRRNRQDILNRFSKAPSLMESFIIAMTNGITSEQDYRDLRIVDKRHFKRTKAIRYALIVAEARARFADSWLKNSTSTVQQWLKDNLSEKV